MCVRAHTQSSMSLISKTKTERLKMKSCENTHQENTNQEKASEAMIISDKTASKCKTVPLGRKIVTVYDRRNRSLRYSHLDRT